MGYFNRELYSQSLFKFNGLIVDPRDISSIEVSGTVVKIFIRAGDTVYERQYPSKGLSAEELENIYLDAIEAQAKQDIEFSNHWNGQEFTGANDIIGSNPMDEPTEEELEALIK